MDDEDRAEMEYFWAETFPSLFFKIIQNHKLRLIYGDRITWDWVHADGYRVTGINNEEHEYLVKFRAEKLGMEHEKGRPDPPFPSGDDSSIWDLARRDRPNLMGSSRLALNAADPKGNGVDRGNQAQNSSSPHDNGGRGTFMCRTTTRRTLHLHEPTEEILLNIRQQEILDRYREGHEARSVWGYVYSAIQSPRQSPEKYSRSTCQESNWQKFVDLPRI